MQNQNPFHRNRAEQMGESMWKYYVDKAPFNNLLGDKPLIYEGSRGSGKTMFFLCNSWREKFSEFIEKKKNYLDFLASEGLVGFYYKIDGRFVGKNLSGKGVPDHVWRGVFNTYFNVMVSKEILHYLKRCIQQGFITNTDIQHIQKRITEKLKLIYNMVYPKC